MSAKHVAKLLRYFL